MADNEVPKSREMVTGESPSGDISDTEPTLAPAPVGSNIQRGIEEKIKALQEMTWVNDGKGQQMPFDGAAKEDFLRLLNQIYPMVAHHPEDLSEIGRLLCEAEDRLRPGNLYRRWLELVGLRPHKARAYVDVYKRFGDHLHRFTHLGFRKLLILSRLSNCVDYVERQEQTIATQSDDELELMVMALRDQHRYLRERPRRQDPPYMRDGLNQERPELHSTGTMFERNTERCQEGRIRVSAHLSGPRSKATLALVDGQEEHVDTLEDMLWQNGYPVRKIILSQAPPKVAQVSELINAASPDLVIMNFRPFSGTGDRTPYGSMIAYYLSSRFHIPVVFYNVYEESEHPPQRIRPQRLRKTQTIAFLTQPFKEQEVIDTIVLALRLLTAEKGLRLLSKNLESEIALRTEELQIANQYLAKEVQERRRAEQSAIESKQRLQAVFDCTADPVFIKDHFFKYRMVNPAMERLMGITESEIIGKTDEDLFGQQAFEHFREVEQRVLNGGSIEEEYSRQVHGVELTFLDSRVPLRNSRGDIVGICGISRDVTDRRGIELGKSPIESEYCSAAMLACLNQASVTAQSDSIVLLLGESGSGKDHVAKYIHKNSERANGPYFAINCAAIPPELAESELFGHEQGAYTGAHGRKRGLLELAEGGTLLLNEIGELPPQLQAKLLTFLDTRRFTRVGAEQEVVVNARLIAATNRDLKKEVDQGRFRRDLYYRINVLSINVPSLRDRREDLPQLIQEILRELCTDLQYTESPIVTSATMKALQLYPWPGNVRELRNVLERSLILTQGKRIEFPSLGLQGEIHPLEEEAVYGIKNIRSIYSRESLSCLARPHGDKRRRPIDPGLEVLEILKQEYIVNRKWSKKQLADAMNVDRTTLSKWLKNNGLAES